MRIYYIHKCLQIIGALAVIYSIFSPAQLCGIPLNHTELTSSCKDSVLFSFFVQATPTAEKTENGTSTPSEIVINETYVENSNRRVKRSAPVKVLPTDEEQLDIHHSGKQKVRKSVENDTIKEESTAAAETTRTTARPTTTTTVSSTAAPVKTTVETKTTEAKTSKKETTSTTTTEAPKKQEGREIVIEKAVEVKEVNQTVEVEEILSISHENVTESNSAGQWNQIAHNLASTARLTVRQDVCVKVADFDILGLGHEFIGHQLRELRTPLIFAYLSILLCMLSCIYVFSKYTVPGRFPTLVSNVLHMLLWAVVCLVLYQFRTNWTVEWTKTSNYLPDYPVQWIAAEILCLFILIGIILETYFADFLHYNLYLEKSAGVYEIIEPARSYNCGTFERNFSVDYVEKETNQVRTISL